MKKTLIIALIAVPILLAMSYPGRDSDGLLGLFSAIGWFGFMLAVLVILVLAVTMTVRRVTRPAAAHSDTH